MIPKYEVINNGDNKLSSIKITDGEYKGLEYKYGEVDFSVPDVLKFTVEVVNYPGEDLITLPIQGALKEMMGDILYNILHQQVNDHFAESNNDGG